MSTPHPQCKHEELLKHLLTGAQKPSGVVDHKLTDKGLQVTISIPKEKLGPGTRDLVALLLSDAM